MGQWSKPIKVQMKHLSIFKEIMESGIRNSCIQLLFDWYDDAHPIDY